MAGRSLIFIPSAAVGHLTSTIEIAKILLSRDPTLSITFLIIRRPGRTSSVTSDNTSDRLRFLDVPNEASDANADMLTFVPSKKPAVKKMVTEITESRRLAGFVVDMLCTAMIDVAAELGVPCYTYITSGASFLTLQLHLQKLCDDGLDADEFEDDCDMELSLPGFSNSIPASRVHRIRPVCSACLLHRAGGQGQR
uniref:Uncharacterized protein n=1 Tax=Kalanchoe fedtschenkoi TaxID=63787 RepID=A0A7N0ZYD6_KALFE